MKQEDKELLLKDLCARLPYGVFLKIGEYSDYTLQGIVHSNANKPLIVRCNGSDFECSIDVVKPYLRPMSSMTSKEWVEFCDCSVKDEASWVITMNHQKLIPVQNREDYLNSKHFDYRGLIEKGLALEAPEGMYNIKEK